MKWTVIGFEKQKQYIESLIRQDALSHAYVFSGPDRIGKRTFAQDAYRLLNGREQFSASDPDVCFLAPQAGEGTLQIYIDDIRRLKSFLALTPHSGPYKAVLIDDAHHLTQEASNALLKVLEEPPRAAVFFLITSQPQSLLPTIRSRCQELRFLPHAPAVIAHALEKKLSKKDAEFVAQLAGGALGWALALTDPDALGAARGAVEQIQKVARQGIAEKFAYAKKAYEKKQYPLLVDAWLHWAHARAGQATRGPSVLRDLVRLFHVISQPSLNHRLALERFLLSL